MPVSSAGEAEASSVPTGGLTLSMPTQDPGEGLTLVRSITCWKVEVTAGSGSWPSQGAGLHSVQQIQKNLNGEGTPL